MTELRIRTTCVDCSAPCCDVDVIFEGEGQTVECENDACYRFAEVTGAPNEPSVGDTVELTWDGDDGETETVELTTGTG